MGRAPCGASGMHQQGWKKHTEGWCRVQGGPLQEQMPSTAQLAGRSQAAPQNPPAHSRQQLMGTIPTPWPSPGCRGFWPLSGGRKGGKRGEEGRPGSPPRSWSLPSPKSRAEWLGRGATGSPITPCPSCTGQGVMSEPRGSLLSAGHRLTPPLQLPGWLCATGIPLPHPPTPQSESQLPPHCPPRPGSAGGSAGRKGSLPAAAWALAPWDQGQGCLYAPSEAITRPLQLEVLPMSLAAPKQGAGVATGQTRPARWPPSSVFLALSLPLPLLLSHVPLLRPEPLKILFSQLIAALSIPVKGCRVSPRPLQGRWWRKSPLG